MRPTHPLRDRSLSALLKGYDFWDSLRDGDEDVVTTRLLGRPAICVRGEAGARFFYETPELVRSTALPEPIVGTLFGHGAVHTLDHEAHRHRKGLFTSVLDAVAAQDVSQRAEREWLRRAEHWGGDVDLGVESREVLLTAVCGWAGVRIDDVAARARDMVTMVDGFGGVGPRHVRARRARGRSERWIQEQVEAARRRPSDGSPLSTVAAHRDRDGALLPARVAAVEVLNLVRPCVAVSWFVVMGSYAFARSPEQRRRLLDGEVSALDVAHELRRHAPFAPYLATRATTDLTFAGTEVPEGALVVLDVWGTDHDPARYERPDEFDPGRFAHRAPTAYDFVPQGGGDPRRGHRCPGEDVVVAVLVRLLPHLAALDYALAGPGVVSHRRMPPGLDGRVRVTSGPAGVSGPSGGQCPRATRAEETS